MKKHYRKENDCLNCGAQLQGKYCHNCGQENLEIKESFGHMLNHAVSDYFHFDHQFFHTLKPLLFKPGKLTTEYMSGRRAQYLHPVKMYIFISLVYFLLIFKSNHEVININNKQSFNQETSKNTVDTHKALTKKTSSVAIPKAPVVINDESDDTHITYASYVASQEKLPASKRDSFWENFYRKKKYVYRDEYGKNWEEHFIEDIRHNMPKMMFILLPLFALILKVAFWKNHKYYVEHLIYAIHLHCFYFLFSATILLITMLLPNSWHEVGNTLYFILFIYTAWYIYRSLRHIYHRSRWRTVSKIIGMSLMYLFSFVICVAGLVLLTVAVA